MRKCMLVVLGLVVFAAPVVAADKSVNVGVGYSFLKGLEEDGGTAPLGAFINIAGTNDITWAVDFKYNRDSEEGASINFLTASVGPRFNFASDNTTPFLQVMGSLNRISLGGDFEGSNTAFGGLAGGGVDIKSGDRLSIRLGADFGMYFDEGENYKLLWLNVGVVF